MRKLLMLSVLGAIVSMSIGCGDKKTMASGDSGGGGANTKSGPVAPPPLPPPPPGR